MEILCPECQRRFLIPEDKLPTNAKVVFTCPSCKGKIPLDKREKSETFNALLDTIHDGVIEFFEEGVKKALICLPEGFTRDRAVRVLEELDYKTSIADDKRIFYAKVRYNHYDVVITSERFAAGGIEENPVLKYFKELPMSTRRNIFLVLISQYKTFDALTAFSLSVDAIINENDLGHMREILQRSLVQYEKFYKVFKKCLAAGGRA